MKHSLWARRYRFQLGVGYSPLGLSAVHNIPMPPDNCLFAIIKLRSQGLKMAWEGREGVRLPASCTLNLALFEDHNDGYKSRRKGERAGSESCRPLRSRGAPRSALSLP